MGSIFDPDRILVRRSGMLGRIIDPINHFSIFLYPPMLDGQVGALCSWEITNHRVGRIRAVIFERWMGLNILFDGPISMAIEIFAIQKRQSLKSRELVAGGLKKKPRTTRESWWSRSPIDRKPSQHDQNCQNWSKHPLFFIGGKSLFWFVKVKIV